MNSWKWTRRLGAKGTVSKNMSINMVLPQPTSPCMYRPLGALCPGSGVFFSGAAPKRRWKMSEREREREEKSKEVLRECGDGWNNVTDWWRWQRAPQRARQSREAHTCTSGDAMTRETRRFWPGVRRGCRKTDRASVQCDFCCCNFANPTLQSHLAQVSHTPQPG